MKWTTSPPSPKVSKTLSDDTAFEENLGEATTVAECPDEWIFGYKRLERRVAVIGDRIILSSLHHPSLNITFTMNWWAHFIAMLEDINDAARFRPLDRTPSGFVLQSLGWRRKCVLDFCLHFVMCGWKSTRSMPAGVVLPFICKMNGMIWWIMSFQLYTSTTSNLPMLGCDERQLGWKACTICYPFGHDSDLEDSDSD